MHKQTIRAKEVNDKIEEEIRKENELKVLYALLSDVKSCETFIGELISGSSNEKMRKNSIKWIKKYLNIAYSIVKSIEK